MIYVVTSSLGCSTDISVSNSTKSSLDQQKTNFLLAKYATVIKQNVWIRNITGKEIYIAVSCEAGSFSMVLFIACV
jgi:hypothetical protein